MMNNQWHFYAGKKKEEFSCVCVCASLLSTDEKRKKRKKEKTGRWKKKKVKKQNKEMRKRIEANIQSFSTNCDQMSFFWKKKRGKKNMISIVFETNIIKQTSGCHHWVDCENEQIYTDGDDYHNSFFLTFNISLNICAH